MFRKPIQIITMKIYKPDGQLITEQSKIVYNPLFSRALFAVILLSAYVISTQVI